MGLRFLALVFCLYGACLGIPSSMVEDIKSRELRPNKVKRVSPPVQNPEENLRNANRFHGNPIAIKRGVGLTGPQPEDGSNDWKADDDFQSLFYNDDASPYGGYPSSLVDLEKGIREGGEAAETPDAMLPELYADNEKRKRRKRDSRKFGYNGRSSSSSTYLSPEEILALLTLYESRRDGDLSEADDDTWLDVPVRPHASEQSDVGPSYDVVDQGPMWSADDRTKRFFAGGKRNDPTREIRYLTGPSKHDYYTLSQLLNNEREAPLYRNRYIF